MRRKAACAVVAGIVLASWAWAQEAGGPPTGWQGVSAQQKLVARRRARYDALKRLAQRVVGLRIDARTIVYDLVHGDDKAMSTLVGSLRGATRVGKARYLPDGICEVVCTAPAAEVVQTLKQTFRQIRLPPGITLALIENITRLTRIGEVQATGWSALPDTKGVQMLQTRAAAELDAYRKLAELAYGIHLDRQTTVRNFALASDRIAANVRVGLRWAETTKVDYRKDGCVAVTMKLPLPQIIETIRSATLRHADGATITEEQWSSVITTHRGRTIEATGIATPLPRGADRLIEGTRPFEKEDDDLIKRSVREKLREDP